ncbi:MAG: hypothetical protein JST39_07455, partial [Bacteroidetes bacterium]|nr:hypothetical protein [Bacteroidota bacterium]
AKVNLNLNLFNTRIALGRRQSIAFGMNLRSYTNLKTSRYNFIDTLHNSQQFFAMNRGNNNIGLDVTSSSWVELYGSYARTLYDDELGRLNGGITVKLSRGISGGYASLSNGNFSVMQGNDSFYLVTNASLTYGYSSNYDRWKKGRSNADNINDFLAYTEGGASIDIGFEYLVKPQEVTFYDDDDNYYDYNWKFAVSLLDIGGNQYKYGTQSRFISDVKSNITNVSVDNKFKSIKSVAAFNDSLSTLVNQSLAIGGKFNVINPMRLVLNVDRYLTKAFYVNAEMSLNIPNTVMKKYLRVNELNFITLTPRWETRKWGFYLPMQFNNRNQFWVGGAVKAGPLLIGIHNFANLFSSRSTQNGGGYIALTFHSSDFAGAKKDKRLDCPAASTSRIVR